MSIFNLKKKKLKEKKSDADTEVEPKSPEVSEQTTNTSIPKVALSVIVSPRITEKATYVQQDNAYVFEISSVATKRQVHQAIRELYKVEPRKINIAKNPSKRVFIRGKRGVKTGVKKAYVYLKDGDRIEIT
jgi:large subunit ribosomal protein L23